MNVMKAKKATNLFKKRQFAAFDAKVKIFKKQEDTRLDLRQEQKDIGHQRDASIARFPAIIRTEHGDHYGIIINRYYCNKKKRKIKGANICNCHIKAIRET